VLFPLPTGERANQIYLSKVKALLPGKDLRSISLGGHDFITAPLTDLPLLYPTVASGVSNVRQSSKLPVNSRVHQPFTTSARR
jgi:hypothetical protein